MLRRPASALWSHAGGDPVTAALGHLERDVMEVVWRSPGQSVRDVQLALERTMAYTTVMTTLDRLFKKGLVTRALVGRAFIYSAARTRDELTADLAAGLLAGVLSGGSDAARPFLSNLVDAVGSGSGELLDELERLVRERRQQPAPDAPAGVPPMESVDGERR